MINRLIYVPSVEFWLPGPNTGGPPDSCLSDLFGLWSRRAFLGGRLWLMGQFWEPRALPDSYYFIMGTYKQRPCAFHQCGRENTQGRVKKIPQSLLCLQSVMFRRKSCAQIYVLLSRPRLFSGLFPCLTVFFPCGCIYLCPLRLDRTRSLWDWRTHKNKLPIVFLIMLPFQDGSYSEQYLTENTGENSFASFSWCGSQSVVCANVLMC